MANQKISQLANGNPAQSGDQLPINRGGTNFSVTAGSIAASTGIQHFRTTIPAARVATLGSNPLKLITGVSGTYAYLFNATVVFSIPTGATPYTLGAATLLSVLYSGGAQDTFASPTNLIGFADQTPPAITACPFGGPAFFTGDIGADVMLTTTDNSLNGVDITGGDGDLTVDFYYSVIAQ